MLVIELAALVATVIAAVSCLPQLRHLVATGDTRGVSLSCATLGVATEFMWAVYALQGGLWSAAPEAVLMVGANTVMAVVLVRSGVAAGRAVGAAAVWLALLSFAFVTSSDGTALLLGVGYGVQVTPSVWTAYRTPIPSGLVASTWALVGVEAMLWGTYGLAHGDPATMGFGVVGSLATIAILTRKYATRDRVGSLAADVHTGSGRGAEPPTWGVAIGQPADPERGTCQTIPHVRHLVANPAQERDAIRR